MPAIADNFRVSSDGLTYLFRIREGERWSDGTPLTAEDFAYAWRRMRELETRTAFLMEDVESADARVNTAVLGRDVGFFVVGYAVGGSSRMLTGSAPPPPAPGPAPTVPGQMSGADDVAEDRVLLVCVEVMIELQDPVAQRAAERGRSDRGEGSRRHSDTPAGWVSAHEHEDHGGYRQTNLVGGVVDRLQEPVEAVDHPVGARLHGRVPGAVGGGRGFRPCRHDRGRAPPQRRDRRRSGEHVGAGQRGARRRRQADLAVRLPV